MGVTRQWFVFVIFFVNFRGYNVLCWGSFTDNLLLDACPILTTIVSSINDLMRTHSMDDDGPITSELVAESLKCGREMYKNSKLRGDQLVKSGISLQACSPALLHFFTSKLPPDAKQASDVSNEILMATKIMQAKLCQSPACTPNTFMSFLEHQVIRIHDVAYCKPVSVVCTGLERYRNIDGTCNNLKHPGWGRRNAAFTRIAKPWYADGIYSMPVSKTGHQLPNTRVLSSRLFFDSHVTSKVLNNLNTQWGQFIVHDMMMRAMEVTDEGEGIQCCLGNCNDVLPSEWVNDKCIPIRIPDNDPFYSQHNIKCLNFVRSVTAPRDDCSLGHAEQMNTVTGYLDGSMVYGSNPLLSYELRSNSGGKLRAETKFKGKRGFLPSVEDKCSVCDSSNDSDPCYLAGDVRINQTPTLAALHTLLLREHNRVADILGNLNPLWSDEKLYQETRRIVIAEIQHITYQEWLPLNFGENYFRYYRISPSSLYSRDYNDDVNPGVINGFATALRYLHTLVPDSILMIPSNYQTGYKYKLSDEYLNPRLLELSPDSFDDLIRGQLAQPAGEADPHNTVEITNLLFKSHNKWGLDLVAMDIQRSRDHGIASYNDYREICGLGRARTFQDLYNEMSQDRINALAQLYESVDDIELYVGGSLERDVHGSILGQTFQCIVAEQFYRTRIGDRFFYDHSDKEHSFTPEQLTEIKKASMARLICDNTDGVYYVQKNAFEQESTYNPKYRCDDYNAIPYVDLKPWKKQLFDIFD